MHKFSVALAVLAAWTIIHATPALAQNDGQGSVEVNLDVLKDIREYQPPPMFDPKQAPLTGYGAQGDKAIKKFPMAVETRHNSINPNFKPHDSIISAQPAKATMSPIIEVERVPVSAPVLPQSSQAHYAQAMPPLPKKKPDTERSASIESSALPPPVVAETLAPVIGEEKAPEASIEAEPLEVPPEGSLAAFGDPAPSADLEPIPSLQKEAESSVDSVLEHAMQVLSFPFTLGATEMDQQARQLFDDQAVILMKGNPDIRVQVQAYATAVGEGQSTARRLSLTRAMSIRSYLIQHEIDPKRIDIRALGTQPGPGPQDRVDLVFINKSEAL